MQTKIVLNQLSGEVYATTDDNQEDHEKVIEIIDHGDARKVNDCVKIAKKYTKNGEDGFDFDDLSFQVEMDKAYPEDY